jgi:uncharacterized membrane protein
MPARLSPRARRIAAGVVLALALAVTVALRAGHLASKRVLEHDEAISYLSATGHQVEWAEATHGPKALAGRWVPARDWKRLIRPEGPVSFGTIRHDLAVSDIHPPLYFWLLALWMRLFPPAVWTGAALNLPMALAALAALFFLARRVMGDELLGAAVAFTWAVSPSVIEVSGLARQYDLLALVSVLAVWQALRFADPEVSLRWRDGALMAFTGAAGALTHYHFAVVLAGAGLVVSARILVRARAEAAPVAKSPRAASDPSVRQTTARLGWFVLACAAGAVLFGVLHPEFLASFARQGSQAAVTSAGAMRARLYWVVRAFLGFFGLENAWVAAVSKDPRWLGRLVVFARAMPVVAGLAVLAAAVAALWPSARKQSRKILAAIGADALGVAFVLVFNAGALVFLYLTFRSPEHAMRARYLAMVWPFMAFVSVLMTRRWDAWPALALAALLILPVSGGDAFGPRTSPSDGRAAIAGARRVVLDNLARGILPVFLVLVPDDADVYAASQDGLVKSDDWTADLAAGDVLISKAQNERLKRGQDELMKKLEDAGFAVERTQEFLGPGGTAIVVKAGPGT